MVALMVATVVMMDFFFSFLFRLKCTTQRNNLGVYTRSGTNPKGVCGLWWWSVLASR